MILAQTGLPVNIGQFITDPPIALIITLLIFAVVGAWKGWWIPRFIYDEKDKQLQQQVEINRAVSQALKDLAQEIRQRSS